MGRTTGNSRWRRTVHQGLLLWVAVAFGWLTLPADPPFQLAIACGAVYGALLLPTAVYFEVRQVRSTNEPL